MKVKAVRWIQRVIRNSNRKRFELAVQASRQVTDNVGGNKKGG